jgi:hypothetical protein
MFDENFDDQEEITDSFDSIIDSIENEICGTIFDNESRQNIERKLIEIASVYDYHSDEDLIEQFFEQSNDVTFTNLI